MITTFNRKELLQICLNSLRRQDFDHQNFEVCIIDDGSNDGTSDSIVTKDYPFTCKIVSISNGGPSNARNVGSMNVVGEYIVFLEDDVTVHNDWLKNAFKHIKDNNLDVLEGRTIYQTTSDDVRRFDNEKYYSFIPCNLFIRRKLFLESGGYDPEFNSVEDNLYFRDDTELGFRLMKNSSINIAKKSDVVVEHPEQFTDIRRCFRHALRYQFDPLLYKKHPKEFRTSIDVKKIFGITLHRPQHYAFLVYIVLVLILGLSMANIIQIENIVLIVSIIILSQLFRFKYQGASALKIYRMVDTIGFFILPFVYLFALVKGSLKYRSYGALI